MSFINKIAGMMIDNFKMSLSDDNDDFIVIEKFGAGIRNVSSKSEKEDEWDIDNKVNFSIDPLGKIDKLDFEPYNDNLPAPLIERWYRNEVGVYNEVGGFLVVGEDPDWEDMIGEIVR